MSRTQETLDLLMVTLQDVIKQILSLNDPKSLILDQTKLEVARESSRNIHSSLPSLHSLLSEASKKLSSLDEKIQSSYFHHGLNDIPDEVLSDILVVDCLNPVYDLKVDRAHELQCTCRRFKEVLLDTPQCWSRITRLTQGVNLDKRLQLHIEFDMVVDRGTRPDLIAKYAGRIGSLQCEEDAPSEWYGRDCEFSSVKSLVIHGSGLLSSNWILPHLTRLECSRVPPPGLFPTIRHCVLKTCYMPNGDYPTVQAVDNEFNTMKFLATTPLLLSLSLFIHDDRSLSVDYPTISLPRLQDLTISTYEGPGVLFQDRLLNLLDVPSLKNMQITFHKTEMLDWPRIPVLTKFSKTASLVKSLALTCSWSSYSLWDLFSLEICLHRLHSDFFSLQRLEISEIPIVTGTDDDSDGGGADGPVLDHLKMVSYSSISDAISLLHWYKTKGADLDRVEVRDWTWQEYHLNELKDMLSTLFPKTILHCL